MRNIFWFRHDLRLSDNTGFYLACRAGEVVPCVIIDPSFYNNPAIGPNRCALFLRAVESLASNIEHFGGRLIVRKGKPEDEIPRLLQDAKADGVFCNRDYEPYAIARDERVDAELKSRATKLQSFKDLVIFERGEVLTQMDRPYTIYSQFKKTWLMQDDIPSVLPIPKSIPFAPNLKALKSESAGADTIVPESTVPEVTEASAKKLFENFLKDAVFNYPEQRNLPSVEGTSRLSPHLKFGTISPRTVYHRCSELAAATPREAAKKSIELFQSEIIWRDFFFQIMAEFPHVQTRSFRPQYDAIKWENSSEFLERWKTGRTGYPIVDAGMRQLRQSGWMHNRVRMIVASFFCKDLLIDWREGERHFSRLLIDGEPSVNNGNWQWAAGTGTDAQPYFRIFNPTSQGQKFDPKGTYVRTWIPELKHLDTETIHEPWTAPLMCPDYPAPIVDHAERRKRALELYQSVRG